MIANVLEAMFCVLELQMKRVVLGRVLLV
jgi:hypothetical protein